MNILPHDYYTGAATDKIGLAKTAGLIALARAEVKNCLLFDNGDFLQGNPLGDYAAQMLGTTGAIHPMFAVMNHLRYDAGTLGNHEFNYGLTVLETALEGAGFPIVSANVHLTDTPQSTGALVPPFVLLDRVLMDENGANRRLRIGVIGFTPPQILQWDRAHLAGRVTTRDIVEAAKACVPQMKRAGADIIVALSHSGIGSGDSLKNMENASTALAGVEGIDILIAGHSHLVFPSGDFAPGPGFDPVRGTLCGKPAVMPGFNGSHLGVIDVVLTPDNAGLTLRHCKSEVRPIWQQSPDGRGISLADPVPEIATIIAPAHLAVLDWVEKPIGQTGVALHSYFALVTEAPALQAVAAAKVHNATTLLCGTAQAGLPVLASVAAFKAGGRGGPENYTCVPVGTVKLRHAADLYIHSNAAAALRLSGAEVADWLESAASIFNQIPVGAVDAPLINPDFPSFNFDMIHGLSFQIDLSKPPRFDARNALINPQSSRIQDLRYLGAPLDPAASFAIATNSYRIATKRNSLPVDDDQVLFLSTETNLDVVRRYFATCKVDAPFPASGRRFAAMPHTTVTFDTSPRALAHLAEVAHLAIEPLQMTQAGFLRFRLRL